MTLPSADTWFMVAARMGQIVLTAVLSAAALLSPACGDDGASESPSTPGGNVDPAASSGVGGVVNKAKDTAEAQEQRDATIDSAVPARP